MIVCRVRIVVHFTMVYMTCFESLPNKYGAQVSKNKGLYKRHQYFNKVNEDGKGKRYGREANARHFAHCAKYEDEGNETNDNNVTRHHVGEQTYH